MIKRASDLGPIFFQLANSGNTLTIDPTLTRQLMEEAIEANRESQEAMSGAITYCHGMEMISVCESEKSTWKLLAALAQVFFVHCKLRIEYPLKLVTLRLANCTWRILDSHPLKLIRNGLELELFYKFLLSYCEACRVFLKEGFPQNAETTTMNIIYRRNVEHIVLIAKKFFISRNKKSNPNFIVAYKRFVARFKNDLSAKLNPKLFLPPRGLKNILGVKQSIFLYLAADLDARTKDRLIDLYLYYHLTLKMTCEIVYFDNVVQEPKVIEAFKSLLIESYISSSKYAFVKNGSGKAGPKCDADGKWLQIESAEDMINSDVSKNECIEAMNRFCAIHKGESAAPMLHQLKKKSENVTAKCNKLEEKTILSIASLLFN